MKEFAKKFRDFINEAYIDDSGELKDLEISDADQHNFEMQEYIVQIADSLREAGANQVEPDYFEGMIKIAFSWNRENYEIFMDLDSNHSTLMKYASSLSKGETIYDGPTDGLINLIVEYGLTFL
jgi:hypothetical protein